MNTLFNYLFLKGINLLSDEKQSKVWDFFDSEKKLPPPPPKKKPFFKGYKGSRPA